MEAGSVPGDPTRGTGTVYQPRPLPSRKEGKTMTKFDFETYLSETKIEAYKAKAIASAFAYEWVDSVTHATAASLENDPTSYQYLFTAIMDTLFEVCSRLDRLEDETNALDEKETA